MLRRFYAALMIVISLFGTTTVSQQTTLPKSSSSIVEQTQVKSAFDSSSMLTQGEAEAIALNSLGLVSEDVYMERTELDREKGQTVWEVEFYYETTEYDVEVNALTGEIIKTDYEVKNRPTTNPTFTPDTTPVTPSTTVEITKDKALEIVLAHAGLSSEQIKKLSVEKDREDGALVYEIEFYVDHTEYDYKVNRVTGEILKHEKETKTPQPKPDVDPNPEPKPDAQPSTNEITKDKALEIVLAHAGLSSEQIKKLSVEKDRENGALVYEIEFYVDHTEYDYKVNRVTGEILKHEKETKTPQPKPDVDPNPEPEPDVQPSTNEITKDKALEIVLAHAGLSSEQIKKLSVEKDREDGTLVYEIEFENGNFEYEYKLNISNGAILHWEKEFDD